MLDIEDIDEVLALTKYKPHRLTGDRAGYYALSVTPNWRITFGYDAVQHGFAVPAWKPADVMRCIANLLRWAKLPGTG